MSTSAPGARRRTARDAYRQAMRDDLLLAAQAVVDRKGLAGLTIRDVLGEAGVAPATLYAYFAGKDELIAAMVRSAAERVVQRVSDNAADGRPADVVALWALLRDALLRPTPGADLLADVRGRPSTPDQADVVRSINGQLVAGMRPLVEGVRDHGGIATDDVDALVELLDVVWDGLTRRQRTATFVTSYERVGSVLLELLRPGATPPH